MDDLISRQDAIDGLNEVICDHNITDFDAIATILDLPSEQRTGEWIQIESKGHKTNIKYLYKCSECGMVDWFDSNYCPECGAKMQTKGDDNHDI